jgi:hypothetical protein
MNVARALPWNWPAPLRSAMFICIRVRACSIFTCEYHDENSVLPPTKNTPQSNMPMLISLKSDVLVGGKGICLFIYGTAAGEPTFARFLPVCLRRLPTLREYASI